MGEIPEWGDPDYDRIDYLIDNDPIQLGALYREAVGRLERLRLLSTLQAEYIEFLNTANEGPTGLAAAHGWKCPKADYDKGVDFRERIEALDSGIR